MVVGNRRSRWTPYVPNLQQKKWTRNQELCCVAHFPDIVLRGESLFQAGRIVLRYGEHQGPNRGFGFEHIWKEHFGGVADHDTAMADVERFVRAIVRPGVAIHYEAGKRAAIFSSLNGLAIVQEMVDGQNVIFYSVITAFSGRNANGSRVGAVQ